MEYDEIKDDFRMIISHALLGYEDNVSKEDWELVFNGCTQYAIGLVKEKCKEQRQLCHDEILDETNQEFKLVTSAIKELVLNAPEPEFKNISEPTQ